MVVSKFIKKEDVEQGALVTIQAAKEFDVSMENQPTEMKWCLIFKELEKPLVLNVTNMRILEAITGSDSTDDWIGLTVVLFNDKTVVYQGKVGGIRLRAPRQDPLPAQAAKYDKAAQQVPSDAAEYTKQDPSERQPGEDDPFDE
ncbi:MAG TPA: hypothetical protein VMW24_09500 [Sedimentisphaerales bacterium]|nr:hypothetical protein [Sedimentisphaerales bacterium]